MSDIDGYFGFVAFSGNTNEKLFLEYVPDDYKYKDSFIRRFAIVAMFDRKSTESAAFHRENRISSNLYRFLCRTLAETQPIGPRFFYVIGGSAPPWTMIELNLRDGTEVGRSVLNGMNWEQIWRSTGLLRERNVLRQWLTDPDEGESLG